MARLERVICEVAETNISRPPTLTFLVWSGMSSMITDTFLTPKMRNWLSMQRSALAKPVMLARGGPADGLMVKPMAWLAFCSAVVGLPCACANPAAVSTRPASRARSEAGRMARGLTCSWRC